MKLQFEMTKKFSIPNIFEGEMYERLKQSLLSLMLGQKDDVFEGQHDPEGAPWAPLSTKAARKKEKKGNKLSAKQKNTTWQSHKILIDTGTLQNSLSVSKGRGSIRGTEGDEVFIGTNLPYAAIHQFGGVIEKKTLHSMGGLRTTENYSSAVVIPARPFLGFGKRDADEVREKIEAYVSRQGKAG